jgi:hypothetical protein
VRLRPQSVSHTAAAGMLPGINRADPRCSVADVHNCPDFDRDSSNRNWQAGVYTRQPAATGGPLIHHPKSAPTHSTLPVRHALLKDIANQQMYPGGRPLLMMTAMPAMGALAWVRRVKPTCRADLCRHGSCHSVPGIRALACKVSTTLSLADGGFWPVLPDTSYVLLPHVLLVNSLLQRPGHHAARCSKDRQLQCCSVSGLRNAQVLSSISGIDTSW